MLKPKTPVNFEIKLATLKSAGGYPTPIRYLAAILNDPNYSWFSQKELAFQSRVTQNVISQIKNYKIKDCQVSTLARIIAILPPDARHQIVSKWIEELLILDQVLEVNPYLIDDLFGDHIPVSDNLFQDI